MIIKAEAIIQDLHDKIENSNFNKKNIIYDTLSLLGICLQSLRKSKKWTDIVKSLLQWRSTAVCSRQTDFEAGFAPAWLRLWERTESCCD